MNPIIESLTNQRLLWRGFEQKAQPKSIATGYEQLDEKLAGGLPEYGVVEIKSLNGIGEVRLFSRYLLQAQQQGLIVFIAPPALVSSEFLHAIGLDISQVYILTPEHEKDALWCAELCLKSGCCQSVLLWCADIALHQVKRLLLASETGHSCLLLYRPLLKHSLALPVHISMRFIADALGIKVTVDKCRGCAPSSAFIVDMQAHWPEFTVAAEQPRATKRRIADIQVS
ncbi:recombinase RecA [Thalassotalea insulae]|uniref:Recombinase RecA n=1 Tax=Thalassotalea insulae TaxID=2056778 RepID=A0ABQ6GPK0_9GAMM|nr:translesion DNA synthesis-associated protein ImuA [Thalassotalea insulae]GLX77908.1 recombinase RecA [Thalassotalea insulae]